MNQQSRLFSLFAWSKWIKDNGITLFIISYHGMKGFDKWYVIFLVWYVTIGCGCVNREGFNLFYGQSKLHWFLNEQKQFTSLYDLFGHVFSKMNYWFFERKQPTKSFQINWSTCLRISNGHNHFWSLLSNQFSISIENLFDWKNDISPGVDRFPLSIRKTCHGPISIWHTLTYIVFDIFYDITLVVSIATNNGRSI